MNLPSNTFDLIYLDPPFNTGKTQIRTSIRVTQNDAGSRKGFQSKRYDTEVIGRRSYNDVFEDYLGFLEPRLVECHRLLTPTGSLFFHIDYREAHYCKVLLDKIFGRASFINEIIWSYDYGARSRKRWSTKHDNIFWYAKNPQEYIYNYDAIDRIPYMAPSLVGAQKAHRGKTPTDVWWNTIVSPSGKEKTGYPTQKPRNVLDRIVAVHSDPTSWVADFFAGSGTTGESCLHLKRSCVLADTRLEAVETIQKRLPEIQLLTLPHRPEFTPSNS
ncbi:MAG: DNA-methyltransferase [Gammaproteobacteria bacterium]